MTRAALYLLFFMSGYVTRDTIQYLAHDTYSRGYQDSQQNFERTRYTYTDVLVVARHDATHFTLQPDRMTPWEATTCQVVDWQAGQKMRLLIYQQNFDKHCKDVGTLGAVEFYTHRNGNRIIFEEVANAGY